MLRSIMVALAALVLMGPGRDREAAAAEPPGNRDAMGPDSSLDGTRWALPRERRKPTYGPVSEL